MSSPSASTDLGMLVGAHVEQASRFGALGAEADDALVDLYPDDAIVRTRWATRTVVAPDLTPHGTLAPALRLRYRRDDGRVWSLRLSDPGLASSGRLGVVPLGLDEPGVRERLGPPQRVARIAFGVRARVGNTTATATASMQRRTSTRLTSHRARSERATT